MASTTKKSAAKANEGTGMGLRELLVVKVKILYGAELELVKALAMIAKKSNDVDLKSLFEERAEQTEGHAKRLARVCELLGVKVQKMQSEGVRGMIKDFGWIVKNVKGDSARDAAFVDSSLSVGCYKISAYETAIAWAKILEKDEVADLLEQTLEEEDSTNEDLGDLAELKISEKAMPAEFEEDDDDDEDDEDEDEADNDEEKA